MLAHHSYATDAPESQAMRAALKCAAAMVSFVAFLLFCGTGVQRDQPPSDDSVSLARAAAYHQNKPLGSIFASPKSQPAMAKAKNSEATTLVALTHN